MESPLNMTVEIWSEQSDRSSIDMSGCPPNCCKPVYQELSQILFDEALEEISRLVTTLKRGPEDSQLKGTRYLPAAMITNDFDTSVLLDWRRFVDRKQENGEGIRSLAYDLREIYNTLNQAGCGLLEEHLELKLFNSVLKGAYGKTDAVQTFARSFFGQGKRELNEIIQGNASFLVDQLDVIMIEAGLVGNSKAGKLPEPWVGKMNLNEREIVKTFRTFKCPICRIPQGQTGAHFLDACPVLKSRGYNVAYDKSKASSRKLRSARNKRRAGRGPS